MKNTIIIMTSNIGSDMITLDTVKNEKDQRKLPEGMLDELRKYFRIEFLNRIDDIILFHSLSENEITSITRLMLSDIEKRL